MLTRREVGIGKCFVKDGTQIVREVIAELRHRKVVYYTYDLKTGRLLSKQHQICSRKQLIHWSDREATCEEAARLQRDEAMDIFAMGDNLIYMDDIMVETRKSRSMAEIRT